MKTIEDAYKELDGELRNSYRSENSDKYLYWCKAAEQYICTKSNLPLGRQYICTVEEFNNYKGDTVKDKMIPFCLEKALAGEKVVTRDGREITNLVRFPNDMLYGFDVVNDTVEQWFDSGSYHNIPGECGGDLFMAPKMLSGFIVFYDDGSTGRVWSSYENAEQSVGNTGKSAIIDLSQFEEGHGL